MKIIRYKNNMDIDVLFDNGYISKNRIYTDFKNGNIKNPYHRNVYGIGYIGEGKYNSKDNSEQHITWHNMLQRCYDKNVCNKYLSYKDCIVCEEWHNFQIFAKWYDENYYTVDNEKMCLDKDILIKGNKIYGSETCVLAPKRINNLFIKMKSRRGYLPIGVTYNKRDKKFQSRICNMDEYIRLGSFNSAEEAFCLYKKNKEILIKNIAEKYKDKIPQKLYDAMYRYEINIDD